MTMYPGVRAARFSLEWVSSYREEGKEATVMGLYGRNGQWITYGWGGRCVFFLIMHADGDRTYDGCKSQHHSSFPSVTAYNHETVCFFSNSCISNILFFTIIRPTRIEQKSWVSS